MEKLKILLGYRCRKSKDAFELLAPLFSIHDYVLICQKKVFSIHFSKLPMKELKDCVNYRFIEVSKKKSKVIFFPFLQKKIWLLEGIFRFLQFKKNFLEKKHDVLVIWNGHRWLPSLMVLAAKSVSLKIVFVETGYFPNTFNMMLNGVNGASKLPSDSFFYLDYLRKLSLKKRFKLKSLPPKKNNSFFKILLPLQVESDSQIILHKGRWIESFESLLFHLSLLSFSREVEFLVKPHPKSHLHSKEWFLKQSLPGFFTWMTDKNIDSILKEADAVMTINSTVGIEALMLLKPLVVLGNASYSVEDACLKVDKQDDLQEIVDQLLEGWQPDKRVVQSVLSYQFNECHIIGSYKNPDKEFLSSFEMKISELYNLN